MLHKQQRLLLTSFDGIVGGGQSKTKRVGDGAASVLHAEVTSGAKALRPDTSQGAARERGNEELGMEFSTGLSSQDTQMASAWDTWAARESLL